MISSSDSYSTIEMKKYYAILPQDNTKILSFYRKKFKSKKVKNGFEYSSNNNGKFLTVKEIQKIISYEKKNKK